MKALCLFALFGLLIVVGCEDGTDGENETLTVVNQLNHDIVIDFEPSDSSFDIEPKSKRIPADDRLKIKIVFEGGSEDYDDNDGDDDGFFDTHDLKLRNTVLDVRRGNEKAGFEITPDEAVAVINEEQYQ